MQHSTEIGASAAKLTPPVTVTLASILGLQLQDWVYITTVGYLIAQLGYLAWKWHHEWREKRAAKR